MSTVNTRAESRGFGSKPNEHKGDGVQPKQDTETHRNLANGRTENAGLRLEVVP